MADKRDKWADPLAADNGGLLTGILADEKRIDRRMLWRLASWGVAAVGAVVVAVLASQSQVQLRRDQFAASDMLARQSQQLQLVTRETQAEIKRLHAAIDGLGSDRDRLSARVASMEQGFEAATGSIKRQAQASAAPATPSAPAPATTPPQTATPPAPVAEAVPAPPPADLPSIPSVPVIGPVASKAPAAEPPVPEPTSPALSAWKSMMTSPAAPEAAPARTAEHAATRAPSETTASLAPVASTSDVAVTPVARTEFGVDIGGANSVDGLRAIWRGMAKSKALDGLRPIIMVKERGTGLGMQLRLIAGPVQDAAAAARICATLTEGGRTCETTVFDGQRLALKPDPAPAAAAQPQANATAAPSAPGGAVVQRPLKPVVQKRAAPKPEPRSEPTPAPKPVEEAAPAPPPKPQSSLNSFLGMN